MSNLELKSKSIYRYISSVVSVGVKFSPVYTRTLSLNFSSDGDADSTLSKLVTSHMTAMLRDNQVFKMAECQSMLEQNIQFLDNFAGLDGPAESR